MNLDINNIIALLFSSDLQSKLLPIKIIFLLLTLVFVGFIIFALFKTHYLEWMYFRDMSEFLTYRPFGAKKITKDWNKILGRLEMGSESEYKLSIIEADSMFDASLKRMGYIGETFEEKLSKLTAATLPNIDEVGQAHQIRNNIVHDPDYRLTLDEARKTLEIYDKAFRDLQILT